MSLVPVEEAQARLLEGARPVAKREEIGLADLADRIAAVDLVARRTQPDFDASAMDGYAVRAADLGATPCDLVVVGESAAGGAYGRTVAAGEAVRIFTGAPVPQGADAVVIQENTERPSPEAVRILQPVDPGGHIRRAGNDFRTGAMLVPAGSRFRPASIALAASGGYPTVEVLRRPRVAIAATGDELVLPGQPVGPSQIVASNGYGIAALARAAGAEILDYGIVRDDEAAIGACLDRAAGEADVLVTIGGASVGDHDLIGPVLKAKGATLDFWKIAMRPGKPMMAGRLGFLRILGLPGNPASSLVSSELFVVPLVERLAGRPDRDRWVRGRLGVDLPANDHRAEFMRATLDQSESDGAMITPLGRQDSSLLSIFAEATALLYRPAGAPAARQGDECRFIPLG
ncbi:molybdopterin molybdotransferase MoeA [Aureimonas pseudogalii]|uniref:Molybdopterin molybdenumtransferase n=1 Tax=Aureimonas pseudogalii TaxID=1744844 RepID=A0A7W6MJW8_9HYPH|nr:gephyrin-like molybdotransferase Glp [Aureimonas pseudogalii]MBB3998683.1 molybdopterin molybdotransferase [Aureimonas pseudogalii]